MKSLKILLTNQQGCFHPGIVALAKVLSASHQVIIAAPLRSQYNRGHALTTRRPLKSGQYTVLKRVKFFSIDGTPNDAVALAMDKLVKSKPDLVISGIAPHNNVGEKVYASGVVSSATLGTIHGIPSIAISASVKDDKDESEYTQIAKAFAKKLGILYNNIPEAVTLNVNFPRRAGVKKIKYTHLTCLGHGDHEYEYEVNPFGQGYYFMKPHDHDNSLARLEDRGDVYWLKQNFITVTPLKHDLTNKGAFEILENSGVTL